MRDIYLPLLIVVMCFLMVIVARVVIERRHPIDAVANDSYKQLHIPLFKPTGEVDSDLVATSAKWNRKTDIITFQKPVVYRYRNGKCVQIIQGDTGSTDVKNMLKVNIRGHVRVRSMK